MRFRPVFIAALAALTFAFPAPRAALAVELVLVEQPGCHWCEAWDAQVSPAYPKTSEGTFAPLLRLQLRDVRDGTTGVTFARPVNYTPTFVLVDEGRELARIEGYPGEDFFWGLLGMMLEAHTDYVEPAG